MRKQETAGSVASGVASIMGVYAILCGYFVVVVYPMVWMVYSSLKKDNAIFLHPFSLPKLGELQWVNYSKAWVAGGFGEYFGNSVLVTGCTLSFVLLLSSMTAYALARFTFPGAKPLLFYFLAGLMMPVQMAIVPLFFQMKALHLLGTTHGLIISYVASGLPFAVFVLTGFFKTLPGSLHESAVLDGANELQAFWYVMQPLAKPGLVTVAIFSFLGTWNEFFVAFIFLSGEGAASARTLPLGLANIAMVSQYRTDWGMAFAGLVLAMLPALIVYGLLQKQLTKGITLGALKG